MLFGVTWMASCCGFGNPRTSDEWRRVSCSGPCGWRAAFARVDEGGRIGPPWWQQSLHPRQRWLTLNTLMTLSKIHLKSDKWASKNALQLKNAPSSHWFNKWLKEKMDSTYNIDTCLIFNILQLYVVESCANCPCLLRLTNARANWSAHPWI